MIMNRARKQFDTELEYDVVVIGGGIAGVIASAAAAKTGSTVLLVENSSFFGGIVTMGPLEAIMTIYDEERQVISGIGEELLRRISEADPMAQSVKDTTGYCSSIFPYNAETVKQEMLELLGKYHVDWLLETALEEAVTEGDLIKEVLLRTRIGCIRVRAKSFVDCSGSGILAYFAGNDVMLGDENGVTQPVSVLSRWSGVDPELLREYVRANPQDFKSFDSAGVDTNATPLHLWGFSGALRDGYSCGALSLYREEMHFMETSVPGEVVVNYSRVNCDPYDIMAMSRAQLTGTKQVTELYHWFKSTIPAFAKARIAQSCYVGIRESGRVKGRYVLTREDVINGYTSLPSVAMGSFPMDIHKPGSGMQFERVVKGYRIPAASLQAEKFDNLFMGGRCVSSTFEANGSCRISATCMATGHAAGVMAACFASEMRIDVSAVQRILLSQGAIIE